MLSGKEQLQRALSCFPKKRARLVRSNRGKRFQAKSAVNARGMASFRFRCLRREWLNEYG